MDGKRRTPVAVSQSTTPVWAVDRTSASAKCAPRRARGAEFSGRRISCRSAVQVVRGEGSEAAADRVLSLEFQAHSGVAPSEIDDGLGHEVPYGRSFRGDTHRTAVPARQVLQTAYGEVGAADTVGGGRLADSPCLSGHETPRMPFEQAHVKLPFQPPAVLAHRRLSARRCRRDRRRLNLRQDARSVGGPRTATDRTACSHRYGRRHRGRRRDCVVSPGQVVALIEQLKETGRVPASANTARVVDSPGPRRNWSRRDRLEMNKRLDMLNAAVPVSRRPAGAAAARPARPDEGRNKWGQLPADAAPRPMAA